MSKLRLQLEDLAVDSFETTQAPTPTRGTVDAFATVVAGTCPRRTCGEPTDQYTCWYTCDDASCANTCANTCAATCPNTCANTCAYTCDDFTCAFTCDCGGTGQTDCGGASCWDSCGGTCPP